MKLTKQKLEQLIMEQYKSMSRRVFDKRRQDAEDMMKPYKNIDTYIQVAGDRGMQTKNPEHHEKLARLYGQDRNQASELADALDEPIFLELPKGDSEYEVHDLYPNQFKHWSKLQPDPSYAPVGGWIEIYLNEYKVGSFTDKMLSKPWFVNLYPTDYNGRNIFDTKLSKQFSNSQDAIDYYNQYAVEEYPESKPLKTRKENFKLQPYKK
tara:strand:+ start:140 stop:766 length:627 start_codon:yes stop_codon:yes gene_type:complete